MSKNNPSFIQVRKWIMEAALQHGARMTGNRAKTLAGHYLAQYDPEFDGGRVGYADPTGTAAVRRWMDGFFLRQEGRERSA